MVTCVYCGKNKNDTEMTREHVVPAAIGGILSPQNPFLLRRVCRRCNSACGRYVDGPFLRSWLTSNERAMNALKYLDLGKNPAVPLVYMGPVESLSHGERVCELWLGPTGDPVYHFHMPYPGIDQTAIGVGRPVDLPHIDLDPGYIFLFLRATNPAWHGCILYSVMEQIDHATIYMGNSNLPRGGHPRFKEIPEELRPIHEKLQALNSEEHALNIAIKMDSGDRFLGKLALGFGALFLDESFVASEDATKLRNFIWGKDYAIRASLNVRGSSFWKNDLMTSSPIKDLFGWKPGHIFFLQDTGKVFGLTSVFYGSQAGSLTISSTRSHWQGKVDPEGTIYILAPGTRRYFGPVPLPTYIDARMGGQGVPSELRDFLHEAENPPELPPFELP